RRTTVARVAGVLGPAFGRLPGDAMHDPVLVDHANEVVAGVGEVEVAVRIEHDAPRRPSRLTKGLSHAQLGGRTFVARVAGRARLRALRHRIAAGVLAARAVGARGALRGLDALFTLHGRVDDAATGHQRDVAVRVDPAQHLVGLVHDHQIAVG